ncbi:unnamed protein product, partial [Timema podura]|nr:unnamed protein product [Timema podura]
MRRTGPVEVTSCIAVAYMCYRGGKNKYKSSPKEEKPVISELFDIKAILCKDTPSDEPDVPAKSSNEILSELFSQFNAEPPKIPDVPIIESQDELEEEQVIKQEPKSSKKKKAKKSKKKHRHKEKEKKIRKKDKRKREDLSSERDNEIFDSDSRNKKRKRRHSLSEVGKKHVSNDSSKSLVVKKEKEDKVSEGITKNKKTNDNSKGKESESHEQRLEPGDKKCDQTNTVNGEVSIKVENVCEIIIPVTECSSQVVNTLSEVKNTHIAPLLEQVSIKVTTESGKHSVARMVEYVPPVVLRTEGGKDTSIKDQRDQVETVKAEKLTVNDDSVQEIDQSSDITLDKPQTEVASTAKSSKIVIKNLKFSSVFEATVRQVEEAARLKAEKYEEGEITDSSTGASSKHPTDNELSPVSEDSLIDLSQEDIKEEISKTEEKKQTRQSSEEEAPNEVKHSHKRSSSKERGRSHKKKRSSSPANNKHRSDSKHRSKDQSHSKHSLAQHESSASANYATEAGTETRPVATVGTKVKPGVGVGTRVRPVAAVEISMRPVAAVETSMRPVAAVETSNKARSHSREKIKSHRKSEDRSRARSRSRDKRNVRSRSKEKRRGRSRSGDKSKSTHNPRSSERGRHRSRSRGSDKDVHRRHNRSRSRSGGRIDKQKLLEIARKNAMNLLKQGALPSSVVTPDKVVAIKAGGKSVAELTDFCKQLSKKEAQEDASSNSGSEHAHNSDSDTEHPFHHPFQIKERPSSIVMNIRNAVQLPVKTLQEKTAEQSKHLRIQFPVSSGQQHRKTESEWVPVSPKKDSTCTALVPLKGTPSIPAQASTPPIETSVFPVAENNENLDIGSIVSQRLTAMRKLQENPHDVQALNEMYKAQKSMQNWAESKQQPGMFTGSTGVKVLSAAELSSGFQAWAKKKLRLWPLFNTHPKLKLQTQTSSTASYYIIRCATPFCQKWDGGRVNVPMILFALPLCGVEAGPDHPQTPTMRGVDS